jgi:hypothetical protein
MEAAVSIYVTVKDGNTHQVIDQWVIDPELGTRQRSGEKADAEAEYAVMESLLAHKYQMTAAVRAKCEFDPLFSVRYATIIMPGKARRRREKGNADITAGLQVMTEEAGD